jgi:cytochrome oxidase Cu insertion factor (SCO1/SenC/PrrC family)
MIMIIALTLSFLVALNFILLFLSCNKASKKETTDRPHVLENIISRKVVTKRLPSSHLAPTGS